MLQCCMHVQCVNDDVTLVSTLQDFVSSCLYPVLIISYEMFLRTHEALSRVCFDLMVCDEGHRLKNSAIKTTSVSVLNC